MRRLRCWWVLQKGGLHREILEKLGKEEILWECVRLCFWFKNESRLTKLSGPAPDFCPRSQGGRTWQDNSHCSQYITNVPLPSVGTKRLRKNLTLTCKAGGPVTRQNTRVEQRQESSPTLWHSIRLLQLGHRFMDKEGL